MPQYWRHIAAAIDATYASVGAQVDKLYNRCMRRILEAARKRARGLTYAPPPYMTNFPTYDRSQAIKHVVIKLRERGFAVNYNENGISVAW